MVPQTLEYRAKDLVPVTADTVHRFWSKVNKDGPPCDRLGSPCWTWTAAVNRKGETAYGVFALTKRRLMTAHAFSYWLKNGVFVRGIDHHCHTRLCVNPAHLRLLSNKQNIENRGGLNKNNTSGVRGVYWDNRRGYWVASATHNRKKIFAGTFKGEPPPARPPQMAIDAVVALRNELFTHNEMDRK